MPWPAPTPAASPGRKPTKTTRSDPAAGLSSSNACARCPLRDDGRQQVRFQVTAGSMLAAARLDHPGARCRRGVGDAVGVEYVSRVPRPPLDGLIDDIYYLEGAPPYARLTLPPAPAALFIVNLGEPFRIRAGTDIETAEYADGCVITTPTRALEFGYPPWTRSVGVHFKPWGLAPFLPMPAAELCDRPVTIEQV